MSFAIAKVVFYLFAGFFVVLWFYALIEIIQHKFKDNEKIVWLLLVILLPCIGTILYFWFGRKSILQEVDEYV